MPLSLVRTCRWPLVALLLLWSLANTGHLFAQPPAGNLTAETHGIQLADMDLSTDPATDFYRYANGGWLDRTAIPPDLPTYSLFDELNDRTEAQLIGVLSDSATATSYPVDSDPWKAIQFYRQGIDLRTRNAQGFDPIRPVYDAIEAAPDLKSLHSLIASPLFLGLPEFFSIDVFPDLIDSSVNVLYISGPQLGLPDVVYYTESSPSFEPVRQAYREAAANLFRLGGMAEAESAAAAQEVYVLETAMATHMVSELEAPDISVIYNQTTIDGMQQDYPLLDWLAYVQMLGAPVDGSALIINLELELFQNLRAILESTPLETVKNYLRLQLLIFSGNFLSEDFQEATFPYRQSLVGVEQQEPTEEEVLLEINKWMGDSIGQVYVAEFFPVEAREQGVALVESVVAAFRSRLEANHWMSLATRDAALEKLSRMRLKVGFPNTWRSYAAVEIGDSYFETFNSALVAETTRMMSTAGQTVDREEWIVSPQIVNAFYNAVNNEIIIPAAVLQPPLFDLAADPASNYGSIGFIAGHEITHGFDFQGSQFDADGNFGNWWTEEDNAAFQALSNEVIAMYSAIEVLPGSNLDGQLTLAENVADLGGAQVAYDALQLSLAAGAGKGLIDGLTQQQRFFIAAASAWRQVTREELLETLLITDTHAPAFVRGTLPLQQMSAFHEAFSVESGDAMFLPPEDRITVW